MKALKVAIVFILVLNGIYSLTQWLGSSSEQANPALEAAAEPDPAASGFDLAALTNLTKEIRSGQELERRLNEKDGINNLDLNDDGKADYIQVQEFGKPESGKVGYSLYTEPAQGERQEVAEVTVEQNGEQAEIQVVGNEQIYGDNSIFNDSVKVEREVQPVQAQTQAHAAPYPVYPSYFMPHPLWISPFGFGFYPPYFSFFPILGPSLYFNRVAVHQTVVRQGPSSFQSNSNKTLANPNKGRAANTGVAKGLRKPTGTQKQFLSSRSSSKIGTGGFGRKAPSTRGSRSLSQGSGSVGRSSAFGRSFSGLGSSRGFGGSVRSFGGGRSFGFGGK